MYKIKLMLDFLHGPIWIYDQEEYLVYEGIPLITNDPVLSTLDNQANEMHSSYYEFNSHDQACWFDEEREKAESGEMLKIIRAIRKRLDEINDGSFIVTEDYLTPFYEKLAAENKNHGNRAE